MHITELNGENQGKNSIKGFHGFHIVKVAKSPFTSFLFILMIFKRNKNQRFLKRVPGDVDS